MANVETGTLIAFGTDMVTNQAETGAIVGAGCAGFLSLLGGVLIPMGLAPDSNLAPIVGFFVAPPAAIIGLFLGAAIGSWRLSTATASIAGVLIGGLLGGMFLWKMAEADLEKNTTSCIFLALVPVSVFSVTGVVVRKVLDNSRDVNR